MIISLIGFMAAGKTTMGRELSAKLGAPLIDTDAYIEEREGKTVSEIFAAEGESGFRRIEEECLEDILEEHISQHPETLEDMTRCTLVLSLGGGIVTTPGCRDLISRFTYCVYVKTDIDTILDRLSKDTWRTAATPHCGRSSSACTKSGSPSTKPSPAPPSDHFIF